MTEFDLELWSHGLVKEGYRHDEWEDAASFSSRQSRLAVADGATTAFRAGAWADCLTQGWLSDPIDVTDERSWRRWLRTRADEWREDFDVAGVPYYVRAAAERGSFAAFLGVELGRFGGTPRWRAIAVGDSCLFHLRNDRLIDSFPLVDPSQFGFHPPLAHTGGPDDRPSADGVRRADGELHQGDVILLATDALAEWSLRVGADDPRVWAHLRTVDADGLERLVVEMRRQRAISNDDVTLVRCGVKWVETAK